MSWFRDIFSRPTIAPTDIAPNTTTSTNDDDDDDETSSSSLFEYENDALEEQYFEYMEIHPDAYAVRRVGTKNMHYLVTADNIVYKWCVRLAKEVRYQRTLEQKRRPVNAMESTPKSVPGIVGAFVQIGLGENAKFVFEQPSAAKLVLTDEPRIAAADRKLHESLLDGVFEPDASRIHLSRFKRTGFTGGTGSSSDYIAEVSKKSTARRSPPPTAQPSQTSESSSATETNHLPPPPPETQNHVVINVNSNKKDKRDFSGFSPVDINDKKRWFVIAAPYWELYKAYEHLHFRSGCYLFQLGATGQLTPEAREECEAFNAQYNLYKSLEFHVKRMSDPKATEADRAALLRQAMVDVANIDVLKQAQISKKSNSK